MAIYICTYCGDATKETTYNFEGNGCHNCSRGAMRKVESDSITYLDNWTIVEDR